MAGMPEIWITEHDDFPVYGIEGPPPAGQEPYYVAVQVDDVTLAAWREAIARYGEVQDALAALREIASVAQYGSLRPD